MNSLLSSILPVSPRFWPEHGIEVSSLEAALSDFPSGDHHPVFPRQLDRDIYEQIPAGSNETMVSHDRFDTCPRHLRPEFIAVKARCTRNEAIQLADALAVLDADERLASEVCRWVRHRGPEATLSYLHKFVVAVAEVESVTPDDLADIPTGKLREYAKALGEPPRFGRHQVVAAVQREEERLNDHTEPETIGYHKLGDDCPDNDWISQQPPWFQMLIAKVKACASVDDL
jgi:hypothetical protein